MNPPTRSYLAFGVALGAFHDGKLREQAWLNLAVGNLVTPTLIAPIDFATVDRWYGMFEGGFPHNAFFPPPPPQQIPMDFPVQVPVPGQFPPLVQVPAPEAEEEFKTGQYYLPILGNIIRDLSPRDQRSMRLVCKQFQNHIENEDSLLRKIKLLYNENSIIVSVKSGLFESMSRWVFRKIDGGCLILHAGNTIGSEATFVEEALKVMKTQLENMNIKVEKLTIGAIGDITANAESRSLFEGLTENLGQLKKKLYVESIKICTPHLEIVDNLFRYVDQGTLVSLHFKGHPNNQQFSVHETVHLKAHLKNLKKFISTADKINVTLSSIGHIHQVLTRVTQPTLEEVMIYRQKLCNTMESHILEFDDNSEFLNALQTERILPQYSPAEDYHVSERAPFGRLTFLDKNHGYIEISTKEGRVTLKKH